MRCGSPNVIKDCHAVAEEFSVQCHRCERRAMYSARDMKVIEGPAAPEAQAPSRRGFGTFGVSRSA
ncbi:hypothetical protein [Undibacter mobilis]|uniref:Uncharacterized protein n=1 Tax=Undibacter mobilis TaxID=2292256 RepID=A0A371BCD7_9BRAD|nr:hypothetical protein [Undibacter mobilis]RDV05218.1 hypothetical protein DXH78_11955 [Undibacter mobilis]